MRASYAPNICCSPPPGPSYEKIFKAFLRALERLAPAKAVSQIAGTAVREKP